MVKAFDLAFDLAEEDGQNKQLNQRLVSRDEEVQVRSLKSGKFQEEAKISIFS